MIRSLSASGAALQIPASTPTAFELTVERDGAARLARTVWRNGNRRGVSFEPPPVAPPVADRRRSIAELRAAVRFTTVESPDRRENARVRRP